MSRKEENIIVVCVSDHPIYKQYKSNERYSAKEIRNDDKKMLMYIIKDAHVFHFHYDYKKVYDLTNSFEQWFERLDIQRKNKIDSLLRDLY